jgi:hypothetical protein
VTGCARFDRDNRRKLVIVGDGLATRRLHGGVWAEKPEGFARSAAVILGAEVRVEPDEILIDAWNRASGATALAALLHRRARRICVGAIDAAIARLGLEHGGAPFAVVEVLAGVRRHGLALAVAALRTDDGAHQDQGAALRMTRCCSKGSQVCQKKAKTNNAVPRESSA